MTLEQRKQILYEIGDLRYKNYDSQAYFDKQQRANLSNLQQLFFNDIRSIAKKYGYECQITFKDKNGVSSWKATDTANMRYWDITASVKIDNTELEIEYREKEYRYYAVGKDDRMKIEVYEIRDITPQNQQSKAKIKEEIAQLFDEFLSLTPEVNDNGFVKLIKPDNSSAKKMAEEDIYDSCVKNADSELQLLKDKAKERGGANKQFYDDIAIVRNAYVNSLNALYANTSGFEISDKVATLSNLYYDEMSAIKNTLEQNEYTKKQSQTRKQR